MIAPLRHFNSAYETTGVAEYGEAEVAVADATGSRAPVAVEKESVNASCSVDFDTEATGYLPQLVPDRVKFSNRRILNAENPKSPLSDFDAYRDSTIGNLVNDREQVAETVLDEFRGRVEEIRDGVAHVTLEASDGTTFHGAREAIEFERLGIGCGDRFICRTVKNGFLVNVKIFAAIPQDVHIDAIKAIDDELADIFDF
jgi:hypothetical protein